MRRMPVKKGSRTQTDTSLASLPGGRFLWLVALLTRVRVLHHLHDDGPGPSQDETADGAVVQGEDIQAIHRHNKVTDLWGTERNILINNKFSFGKII